MENNSVINGNGNSNNLSKKRGRKRKNDKSDDQLKPETNTSRSGRRRKQINYYELANPGGLEEFVQVDTKRAPTPGTTTEKRQYNKKSKISNNETDTNDAVVNSEQLESLDNHETEINCIDSKNSEENCVELEQVSNAVKNEDNCDKTRLIDDEKSDPLDRKYNYTGETVKMMNTLFSIYKNDNTERVEETENMANNSKKIRRKPSPDNSTVICAVCNNSMDKTLWSHHKQRYHNNLAWRIGEPPLDLSDQALVMRTLNSLYKKKKPLYCDKCGEVKKSVVGFLSHQAQCKKSGEQIESVKVACEICGKRMLPVSLITHLKFIHVKKTEESVEETTTTTKSLQMIASSKRSAARKALKIIENFAKDDQTEEQWFTTNLNFRHQDFALTILRNEFDTKQKIQCKYADCKCEFDSLDDALDHFGDCNQKPVEGFACKTCLMVSPKLEDVIYHIEMTHDIQINVKNDDNYCDKSYNAKLPHFLANLPKRSNFSIFPLAFEWTFKFVKENFSNLVLEQFQCKPSDWLLLPFNNVAEYLPKLSESCETAHKTTTIIDPNLIKEDYKFKKYELFEYEQHDDGKFTIFCGGPIISLAWLPTPYDSNDSHQIIAVSILNEPDEKYLLHENYSKSTAIQFWDFGILKNRQKPVIIPKLIFSLVHNHGPVWHMEWCPSGCFNKNNKNENFDRMGLLSVTGSDSKVYVYSIPYSFENNEGLYFKPKPVLKLLLQKAGSPLLGGLKYYPRRMSWSKGLGHNVIAVGYTNGFVAIFNLTTNSCILKQKDCDGVYYLLPSKVFQAHSHSITALVLHPLNSGVRWLLTGSLDRNLSLWDLENPIYPISQSKKNIITDSVWLNHWLSSVATVDEGSTQIHVSSSLKQARDFMCDSSMSLLYSQSTITTLDGSDWLNAIVQGNTVGEIKGIFFNQLCVNPMSNRAYKRKRLLFGYTYLLEKSKTPKERYQIYETKKTALHESSSNRSSAGVKISPTNQSDNVLILDEPIIYEEAAKKYALLFCDNKMESVGDFPEVQSSQLTANSKFLATNLPNQYPLNAVTKIVFNPNRQASLYYATGYQAGFLRLSWISFLRNDSEIR